MSAIDHDLRAVLRDSLTYEQRGDETRVGVSGQLDANLWKRLSAVMKDLGGVYRKPSSFVFAHSPGLTLAALAETGDLNPLAYFPTPTQLTDQIVRYAAERAWPGLRILEPSAGQGAFVAAALEAMPDAQVVAVEADPTNLAVLRRRFGSDARVTIVAGDFMAFTDQVGFDLVLMNPPFSVKGDPIAYATHTLRAYGMLVPDGVLHAIVPSAWTSNKQAEVRRLADLVTTYGDGADLDRGQFRSVGTDVATWWLTIYAPSTQIVSDGYLNYRMHSLDILVMNDQKGREKLEALQRQAARGAYVLDLFGEPQADLLDAVRAVYEQLMAGYRKEHGYWLELTDEEVHWLAVELLSGTPQAVAGVAL